MVDVGDNRDVSQVHQRLCAAQKMRGPSTSRSRPPARGFYPDRSMALWRRVSRQREPTPMACTPVGNSSTCTNVKR
jgi:hypothetical protein